MDINNVQNHVNHGLKAPVNRPNKPNKTPTGSSSERLTIRSSIDQYFIRFKPMKETSNQPAQVNRERWRATNPYTDKPIPDPIQPPR